MEGNKDEALKCIHLAEKFINSGHKDKAIKFLNKSLKLYKTDKAEKLLETVLTPSNGETNGTTEGTRKRRRTSSGSRDKENQSENNSEVEKTYTPEQVADVKKIKACKDYYEVLGINKDFSDSELKKSYRKLALKFHPDKNQAPGADEAFKRIGNAFSVLSDKDKRRKYDHYGENLEPTQQRQYRYYHEDEFEGDLTPEDLFNIFFGGGYPSGRVHLHRQHQRRHQHPMYQQHHNAQNVSSFYPLVQILPILLIVLFSLLSSFLIPEPPYSFQQTSQYRYPFTTQNYGITYFVKEKGTSQDVDVKNQDTSIRKQYTNKQFQELERKIERDYIENIQVRCYREKQYLAELRHQARLWGSEDMRERANNFVMESCNQLDTLRGRS